MTPTTKLQTYCTALYDTFFSEAENDEATGLLVWRGYITKTARQIGLPEGTYTRAIETLISLNCIEQIERGYRGKQSIFVLHRAPTIEVWADRPTVTPRLTTAESSGRLTRRVEDLERRLDGLDVKQAFVDMQQQIDSLQKKVDDQALTNNNQ